jgi:hypothetical protein
MLREIAWNRGLPIDLAEGALGQLSNGREASEANDAQINIPDQHNFESEGEVKESTLRRTIEGRTRLCAASYELFTGSEMRL